ncbi:MAG TPA: fucose isomerase [Dictyoglomaceae bacterium]|nr:fucose isomerase [Dictyoglomaceae bacterium]HOL39317.1 fucose isomerase [Dictyoglomaceae bacterium]HOP95030.1 fucose isomerase [Dictyoglomaceae bacterium]HPP16001.1 fucose isomerase [Dictyoglomaceae bacterium]HPU42978.1 fucose isomerase [Dictyoglomaceae bacterium]
MIDGRNVPEVKLGIVAVSRDCFPIELSRNRKNKVVEECKRKNIPIINIDTVIENENDVLKALKELQEKGVNSLVIYLGNFGPEGPTSLLAQKFNGPVMACAAGEETGKDLFNGRGDAYCGFLSLCYNLDLRNVKVYIPHYPIGMPSEVADMIKEFIPIAKAILALKNLKIFSFGPRPQDFVTMHTPIKPLYNLGISIMENSELDLYDIYRSAENDKRIPEIMEDMAKELGTGNKYPELLRKLAQYEIALLDFAEKNLGASKFGIFANKCWPAFEKYFGFVPCYVNSRLAACGIPVACEADVYGALSEYIIYAVSEIPATLLDVNNTVPYDLIEEQKDKIKGYKPTDLFMGFHCGNTASCCLLDYSMRYQLIMNRLIESGNEPDITRGTLEGRLKPGEMLIFRIHATPEAKLRSYIAEGEILDVDPKSFGSIGVFAIKEMGRFYRYVFLEKKFPHHTAVGFKHTAKYIYEVLKLLGIEEIYYNLPETEKYPQENPFIS